MKKILTYEELKKLDTRQAAAYCDTLRSRLVQSVKAHGGHLASNLGIVEISVALARKMDLPREKVIYDTGHQCYVHKMVTGRGEAFDTLRTYGGLSGFPRRSEGEFDPFGTGHSGTGISAALGFARAKRLRGEDGWCVAVIGDGAFTGGMVFEALNNISQREKVIIILNDNGMSISRSVGRLKGALNRMRTAGYYKFKDEFQDALERVPLLGMPLSRGLKQMKNTVKRSALPMGNLFEQYGLHYFGPADGNDLETVEFLIEEAKKRNKPSIIHLCTKKGKGYAPAEENPALFHGVSPQGEEKKEGKSFSRIFGEAVTKIGEKDESVVCITAAMADGVGLGDFARRFPQRFFDVGIAEEHALTFAAALTAGGLKPIFALYSTFYQRAVDMMLHDAALQKLPVILALDRAGVCGEDGATHHGLFDLPLTLPIPGVKIYAPVTEKEMARCLTLALKEKECPSVIRYAKGVESSLVRASFPGDADVEEFSFGPAKQDVLVITFGRITENVLSACLSAGQAGLGGCLLRFCTLKGFDPQDVFSRLDGFDRILFVEEGVEQGGFSQYLVTLLEKSGRLAGKKTRILAVGDEFVPHGKTELLLKKLGLDEKNIEKEMMQFAKT